MSTKPFSPHGAGNEGIGSSLAFVELGRKTLDVMFEWQRQAIEFAGQQNNRFFEAQRRIMELTIEQGRAAAEAARSQSDSQAGIVAGMIQYFADEFVRTQQEWLDFSSRQTELTAETYAQAMHAAQAPQQWSAIERNWEKFAGRLRDRWDRLTGEDLEAARHSRDALIEKLQQYYEMAREDAERQLDEFVGHAARP